MNAVATAIEATNPINEKRRFPGILIPSVMGGVVVLGSGVQISKLAGKATSIKKLINRPILKFERPIPSKKREKSGGLHRPARQDEFTSAGKIAWLH